MFIFCCFIPYVQLQLKRKVHCIPDLAIEMENCKEKLVIMFYRLLYLFYFNPAKEVGKRCRISPRVLAK